MVWLALGWKTVEEQRLSRTSFRVSEAYVQIVVVVCFIFLLTY